MKEKNLEDYCDAVLDMNDPEFERKFAEALGLEPGETLEVVTPQFDRNDGIAPVLSVDDWEGLRHQKASVLRRLGCRPWDADTDGTALMLFPAEWFGLIPDGFQVEDIFGEQEVFYQESADDDRRLGVLAYGVRVQDDINA